MGGKGGGGKAKPKFKSYAEARKDREKFRKKLVTKLSLGKSLAMISIFSATFCLAQPKQVNMGLKTIFGSSNIHLD